MDKWLNHFDIEVDPYNKDEGGMSSADKERTQNKMKLFGDGGSFGLYTA